MLLQVLICPVTDSDTDSLSYTDPANQLLLDRDEMIWFWDQYAPDLAARRAPRRLAAAGGVLRRASRRP